jgi:carbonic anhydrase
MCTLVFTEAHTTRENTSFQLVKIDSIKSFLHNFAFFNCIHFPICCFVVHCDGTSGEKWNYEDKGEDYWPKLYAQCAAKQQSPINIITANTKFNRDLKRVKAENTYKVLNFSVFNTGDTGKNFGSKNARRFRIHLKK